MDGREHEIGAGEPEARCRGEGRREPGPRVGSLDPGDARVVEPLDAELGIPRELAGERPQQRERGPARPRGAAQQQEVDVGVPGRREAADDGVGEAHHVVGAGVRTEPRRSRIDRVEVLGRDRAGDRGAGVSRRGEFHARRVLDRVARGLVARGDAQDLLPHSGAAVGSDISQERAPGEQLEGRMEHERVRGVTPRDGDDPRGGGEELLVGERVEAAGRVRRAYVGGIDPEAVVGRGGGIASWR